MSDSGLARTAGFFYALNIIVGIVALVWARQGYGDAATLMTVFAALEYSIVVVLLACLFEDRGGAGASWGVAAIGLVGCAFSGASAIHLFTSPVNALAVFGLYCIGLGALVLRSDLLPRSIGLLLILGGLSWMTYLSHGFALRLQPFNMALGALAELVFTLWLLIFGVRSGDSEIPGASAPA